MKYCPQCKQTFPPPDGVAESVLSSCPVCGSALTDRRILAPGTVVNGFTIIREIGHGGMGVVYLARQVNLERYVALKVLEDSLTGDQEFVDGFFREARSAASLSHPNIVQAYDAGIAEGGIYFFVMELIDGENLDRYVAEHGALDLIKGLEIASRISHALAYAWEHQHLCHGDIKPENIILKANGEVKLADLGLARDYRKETLRPGEVMATPAYAPPEIIRAESEKVGFRSDMYSFGATLYHIFAGTPPFPGDDPVQVCSMQLNNQPKPLIAMRSEVPSQLSILVDKLMEKSPNNRPESWEQVAGNLDAILRGLKHSREKEEIAILREIQNRNQLRLKKTVIAALAVLALILAVLAALQVLRSGTEPVVDLPHPEKAPVGAPPVAGPAVEESEPADSQEVAVRISKTEALAKWNALKTSLPAMAPEDASRELKNYIEEHPFDVEDEAMEYLNFLNGKIAFEKGLGEFRKQLYACEKECQGKTLLRSSNENELRKGMARIDSLFGAKYKSLCEQAPRFDVDPASLDEGKKTMLVQYRQALNTRLSQIREHQRIEREKKREAKEKAAREELEKKQFMEACESEFKELCVSATAVSDREAAQNFSDSLEKWRSKYASAAPDEYKEGAALLRVILPDAFIPEHELLHKFRTKLAGQEILPGYRFCDASEKGILCQYRSDSGVLVTSRIPWEQTRGRAKKSVLYRVSVSPELFRCLSGDQQTKLFKCLVAERHPEEFYQAFLDRATGISANSKPELLRAAGYYLSLFAEPEVEEESQP